uniref:NAD(P)(+) transhydrogenase (Si-specific) n=1 Tax=Spongospora subterranea TaxID=70186 RepID=A0A0H5QM21_9EUKA|eukprot:CRZ03205.1 hypothetical protein [Spongospora subterranea]
MPIWRSILRSTGAVRHQHHRLLSTAVRGVPDDDKFDLVVIGSGPAGQKCAINAAKMHKRVAIVDRHNMIGGVCVHTGTVPSKTFREAILYLTGYRQRGFYGRDHQERERIDFFDIMDRVKKVEGWETEIIMNQLQRNHVTIIRGTASFIDKNRLKIVPVDREAESTLQFDHAFIATGTNPAGSPIFPFDSKFVFDSDSILSVTAGRVPKNMIVVGGGVIALEYASMFNALPGSRVTIIDKNPQFLSFVDQEILDVLRDSMRSNGATFRLGETITSVKVENGRVLVALDSNKVVKGDALLYAVGRQGNTSSLNLSAIGIKPNNRGLIAVNSSYQTVVPHIYAAGDVIGFPALASVSQEQGRIASNHMFNVPCETSLSVFPYGIYTIPEISMIGANERELTQNKIAYETGVAKFDELSKGQMLGLRHGFLKILFCPFSRKLLGVHVIGENATEIIHIGQTVVTMGGTIDYFRDHVFNFPSFTQAYREAALDGLGRL